MSRAPSEKTQLLRARSQLRSTTQVMLSMRQERDALAVRVARAEKAVEEWKQRFDALLKILPTSDGDKRA